MSKSIVDFLNENGILWEPIAISSKKTPMQIGGFMPKTNDYREIELEEIKKRQQTPSEFIGIFTNKINQYDVDLVGYKPDDKFTDLPYFKSITKKLPHYFIKLEGYTKEQYHVISGDLLCGTWSFCKRDAIVYNASNKIKTFKVDDFIERVNKNKFNSVLEKLKKGIDGYDRETWLKICYGLFNTAYENMFEDPISYPTKFSQDGIKYDEKAIDTINKLKYDQTGVKFGTLCKLIKQNKNKEESEDHVNDGDDQYQDWKKRWEVNVFSCKARDLVCHDLYKDSHITESSYTTDLYFVNDNKFVKLVMETYEVEKNKNGLCVVRWKMDPQKREYMDYNFYPPPFVSLTDYNYYNTWNGFGLANYVMENPPTIDQDHCVEVYRDFKLHLSKGDQKVFDYLLQIDAHTGQYPGEKIGVATIIYGSSGTGKGTETLLQISIFGKEYVYQTSDITQVLGQFTGAISKKLIIILDEAVPKNMFDKDGALKSLITEKTTKIERKGKDSYLENSFVRLIITSNSDSVVKISNSDRRMFVICPDIYVCKQYDQFPHNIFELINSKDACKFVFDYLQSIEIKYHNMQEWQYNRPITQEYEEMREASIPSHIQFLIGFVKNDNSGKLEIVVNQAELVEHFKLYISENSKRDLTLQTFYRRIKALNSIMCSKVRQGNVTHGVYTINKLAFENEMNRLNYRLS